MTTYAWDDLSQRSTLSRGNGTVSMGDIFVRSIGIARAKGSVTLMNLAYNLSRVEVLICNKTFGFERISASKIATAA